MQGYPNLTLSASITLVIDDKRASVSGKCILRINGDEMGK